MPASGLPVIWSWQVDWWSDHRPAPLKGPPGARPHRPRTRDPRIESTRKGQEVTCYWGFWAGDLHPEVAMTPVPKTQAGGRMGSQGHCVTVWESLLICEQALPPSFTLGLANDTANSIVGTQRPTTDCRLRAGVKVESQTPAPGQAGDLGTGAR